MINSVEDRNAFPRIITREEAENLIADTTPGPWAAIIEDPCVSIVEVDDEDGRNANVADFPKMYEDELHVTPDHNLMAASPDLAHTVIAQAQRIAELEAGSGAGVSAGITETRWIVEFRLPSDVWRVVEDNPSKKAIDLFWRLNVTLSGIPADRARMRKVTTVTQDQDVTPRHE